MRRRQLLPCLGAAALTGCARKTHPRKLRVALLPRFTLAPLYLADELGFFREAGLEVEFHPDPDPAQLLTLLASGQVQVGMQPPAPGFINAALKGARMRLVAARDVAVPGCVAGGTIYGNRKAFPRGLRDLRVLKGKRVAILTQTGLLAFFLDQFLASAGMTRADVIPVTMRQPEAAAAVAAGKLEAVVTGNLDRSLDSVSADIVRSITLGDILPNHQHTFVMFGAALLEGDPERGVSFLWAYLRGVREYRSGKTPRALAELAHASDHDLAAASAACRESISADGRLDRVSIQRFVDWAAHNGYIARAVDASQLIDTRFVEEANRRLHGQLVP